MKKSILNIMLCAVVAMPFTACSTTDDQEDADAKKLAALTEIITEGMQNSEESIKLTARVNGVENEATRADEKPIIIDSDEEHKNAFVTPKDYDLGIMMLAKDIIYDETEKKYPEYRPYNYLNINWTSPKKGYEFKVDNATYTYISDDTWSVPLKNIIAKSVMATDGTHSVIELNPGPYEEAKKYYPLGAYHSYSFFGYGPRQDNVTYTEDSVEVVFPDYKGKYDIIYSEAKHSEKNAYSAKWFRMKDNRYDNGLGEARPVEMMFKHKLAMIQLKIKAGGLPSEEKNQKNRDYSKAYDTKVVSISIANTPKSLKLILANKKNSGTTGHLYPYVDDNSSETAPYEFNLQDYQCYPQPKNPSAKVGDNDNEPLTTDIGDCMMVPVLNAYNSKTKEYYSETYLLNITLEYPRDSKIYHSLQVPMRLPLKSESKLLEGYKYEVVLEIFAPEKANLNSSLKPWVEAKVVGEKPFVNNGIFSIH